MAKSQRVFISYSHDLDEHKRWVLELARYLTENGVEVVFDEWDVQLGDDLPQFMEMASEIPIEF